MKMQLECVLMAPVDSSKDEVLRVTGRVTTDLVLRREELAAMETEEQKNLLIICGSGTPKERIKSCRGVLLEKVLEKAPILKEAHNDTKKMFIVATASDGHKVVFSWQEIFNTSVGDGVMILTEKNGRPLDAENGWFDLLSAEDYFTGSRYVKGLRTIEVLLVQ
ncbi:MAG: molybdopterin-dependent oxidoreductase [Deltaproteobacteria bacterium]|nr:molybdopterin-dependent oxidoreductase [Deltaproteobacteria bacterium]MBF0527243.1 molybdopterin-dependent oxidoreductase [Deltaproteobacteria bacterium]